MLCEYFAFENQKKYMPAENIFAVMYLSHRSNLFLLETFLQVACCLIVLAFMFIST